MSRTRNRFAIATLAAAGLTSAALALSPLASADPAAPAVPAVPGLDVVQQVATDALTPQAAQPVPAATAAVTLPQTVSAPEPQVVPSADISIPQLPSGLLPVPLPSELSFPGDLLSLLPAGLTSATAAAVPVAATAPVATAPAAALPAGVPVFPTAGLP